MHDLDFSRDYLDELETLASGSDRLEKVLESTVYRLLKREPHRGVPSRISSLRAVRQSILRGVQVVQVWYRIDEEARTVTLVSIVEVDLTTL